jgi:MFS family permease
MVPLSSHDPYAAFRVPSYARYWIGGFVSVIGRQMLAVAVGYEIYERTRSATALGLVGLAGALPVILLSLPAGHVADRFNRKRIIIGTQAPAALHVARSGAALDEALGAAAGCCAEFRRPRARSGGAVFW